MLKQIITAIQNIGQNAAPPQSPIIIIKSNQMRNGTQDKLVGFSPSEEFRSFWGHKLDPEWFTPRKKFFSPIIIFMLFSALLIVYLCGSLLFSWDEIHFMFFGG